MSTILPTGASPSGSARQPRRSARPGIPAKCKFCGRPFRARSRTNIYCTRQTCKRKRRLAYMRNYMKSWKADHPDYWKSEDQKKRLKEWREKHPDYFKDYAEKTKKKSGGTSTRRRRPSSRRSPASPADLPGEGSPS